VLGIEPYYRVVAIARPFVYAGGGEGGKRPKYKKEPFIWKVEIYRFLRNAKQNKKINSSD
jgi:hypothetical protein